MTDRDAPPPRRDPLRRARTPVPLPAARSRAALGLAAMAAEGRFALQVCQDCGTVQYPPRDVCGRCLGDRLPWRDVPRGGTVLAATTVRIPSERFFRERAPWPSGLVQLDAGPVGVVHLPAGDPPDARVRLDLRLDAAGRAALVAWPETSMPDPADPVTAAFGADPRHRQVLVTDARAPTAPALAAAFLAAGASAVRLGLAEPWKPFDRAGLPENAAVVELDLTVATSAAELAGRMGDKVDILVNNASHVRAGGLSGAPDLVMARETFEVNCLGLMRLAAAFGPVLRARAAEEGRSAAAFVHILSAWALAPETGFGVYAASQAAARALTQVLRAEMRPAGIRVVDVLVGPIEDTWHQVVRPPKVGPDAVAKALVAALREGREQVVVGDVAREIRAKWTEDPRLLAQETA